MAAVVPSARASKPNSGQMRYVLAMCCKDAHHVVGFRVVEALHSSKSRPAEMSLAAFHISKVNPYLLAISGATGHLQEEWFP